MITTTQEYFANLDVLQNVNAPAYALLSYANQPYEIDLKTREIKAPKFLSVSKDARSETIYFIVDRFIDYVDLAKTCCIIYYNNANVDRGTRIYPVPYYDVFQEKDKIIFPWMLDATVAEKAGSVEFAIQFFRIEDYIADGNVAKKRYSYVLNTIPAKSQILHGFEHREGKFDSDYELDINQFDTLVQKIDEIKEKQKLHWTILDDSFDDSHMDDSEVQQELMNVLENGGEA